VRSDRERLLDILEAADRIEARVARGREGFDADEDLQLALVRLLEIVSEACAGVSMELRAQRPSLPSRAAAGLRNRVMRGYFDIDLDVVWSAAAREMPLLAAAIRGIVESTTAKEEES
jgi:uncharacterized protein with HEPN domain